MFIRNTWYVAALSSEVSNELFARTIAGVGVVMYRTSSGAVAALEDRCAHRQAPLSRGCLEGDEVRCWYHGMRFDASGRCTDIPSQEHIPPAAVVRAFPVVERYGFVWLWLGDRALADDTLIPDYSICVSDQVAGVLHYLRPRTDYRLGIDNFLDSSHVAFVHSATVESVALSEALPETEVSDDRVVVRRAVYGEPSSPLFQKIMGLDTIDRIQECVFTPVCHTAVDTTAHPAGRPDGPTLRTFVRGIFVPETETTCHLWTGIYRDFLIDNDAITQAMEQVFAKTFEQDVDVCEAVQANWRDDAKIINLRADQGLIAARRILDRLLARETVGASDVPTVRLGSAAERAVSPVPGA